MEQTWTCEACTFSNQEYIFTSDGNKKHVTMCTLCNTIRAGYELFVDNHGDPVERTKDKVVLSFGRFSPPTKGHKALFDTISNLATEHNADAFIFVLDCYGGSCSSNPLSIDIRLNILKKMYPTTNLKFVKIVTKSDKNIEEIVRIVTDLVESKKYPIENIMIVEGSDRVKDFQELIDTIFERKVATLEIIEKASEALKETAKNYEGKRITVLQAGKNRKNAFNGTPESISATLVKKAALDGNIAEFTEGVKIGNISDTNIKVLMNEIRRVSGKDPIQGGTRKIHRKYRQASTKKMRQVG
jgi:nicotinic acid mononucleotide adenylyltransferase